MEIIPAIDLHESQVVRLRQGNLDAVEYYQGNPADWAIRWQREGAQRLHIVDLDAAFAGKPCNLDALKQILNAVEIPVQLGGGLRSEEDICQVIEMGVDSVIVGTKACESPDFIRRVVEQWGEKIVVGVDVKNGKLAVRGWTMVTQYQPEILVNRMVELGVRKIIYTDIKQDGMLSGPNVTGVRELLATTNVSVIVSGGISSLEQVKKVASLEKEGVVGIIVGKALYDGVLSLREAVAAVEMGENVSKTDYTLP